MFYKLPLRALKIHLLRSLNYKKGRVVYVSWRVYNRGLWISEQFYYDEKMLAIPSVVE